jgi:predicted RNA-binding Zn-ribbon protein involved in translation (DUF1610 family)
MICPRCDEETVYRRSTISKYLDGDYCPNCDRRVD